MKQNIIIFFLLFPSILSACICIQMKSFNLKEYDEFENILEIEILDEIPDDYEKRVEQRRKDSISWGEEFAEFMPLVPRSSFVDFKIKIHEIYKGESNGAVLFRVTDVYSACCWMPEIGQRFIIYARKIGNDKMIYGFTCQRIIGYDTHQYLSEKRILKLLKHKEDGKFSINQNELIENHNRKHITIQGEFKDGQRTGKWILREPILYGNSVIPKRKKILILDYEKGKITNKKYNKSKNRFIERLTRKWELKYIYNW